MCALLPHNFISICQSFSSARRYTRKKKIKRYVLFFRLPSASTTTSDVNRHEEERVGVSYYFSDTNEVKV